MKKGSAAAKAWGKKMKSLRNKKNSTNNYKGDKMKVAKRKMRRRSFVRSYPKRKSYSKSKSMFGLGAFMIGAVAYGAVRAKMSNALQPLTSKIPLGSIADEAGMILALTLTKKFVGKKVPLVNQVASAGIYVELARIGEEIANGTLSFGSKTEMNSY